MVTTWHPVLATAAETLAWREWLERHTITQPFKQAHREVYLLTDAERATRVYSNRFAASHPAPASVQRALRRAWLAQQPAPDGGRRVSSGDA